MLNADTLGLVELKLKEDKTLLISQATLQSKSIINDNVDWEMIKPVVEVVQDLYLQKLIGTDLFKNFKLM